MTQARPAKGRVAPRTTLAPNQPRETRVEGRSTLFHAAILLPNNCVWHASLGRRWHASSRASTMGRRTRPVRATGPSVPKILYMLRASDLYSAQCANLDESGGAKRCRRYLTMYSGAQLTAVMSSTRQRKSNDRMKLKSVVPRRDERPPPY